jgi:hypothetical protein
MIRLSTASAAGSRSFRPAGSPTPGVRCAPSKHGKLVQFDKFSDLHHADTPHAGEPEPVSCSQARRFIACLDDGALLITDAVCVLLPGIEMDGFIYVEKLLDKFD